MSHFPNDDLVLHFSDDELTDHVRYFDDNFYDDPIYSSLCSSKLKNTEELDDVIMDLLDNF